MKLVEEIDSASAVRESSNVVADALAEALFMRAFTAYERDVEKLFFHYVTGGTSAKGLTANSYLRTEDEVLARKITRAGWRFLSWSGPQQTRETASNYIENGWPISDAMYASSQTLADCERVRNHIAHKSEESRTQFNAVQRNLFGTERLFHITPGQLLRVRKGGDEELYIGVFMGAMMKTLRSIIDPS